MNKETEEIKEPKDALEFRITRSIERALLSPVIKDGQEYDRKQFLDFYKIGVYTLAVGLVVVFLDAEVYGLPFGSFYPFWVQQSAFISSKKTIVKLNLLSRKQSDAIVAFNNRILTYFERTDDEYCVKMSRTAVDYEWRVPLSEAEIEKLDEVFRQLIRRTK